jgi:hypothetical protein
MLADNTHGLYAEGLVVVAEEMAELVAVLLRVRRTEGEVEPS